MKKIFSAFLAILMLCNMISVVMAESATIVEEVGELIEKATKDERQEIFSGLLLYMLFVDGEKAINDAFEGIGEVFSNDEVEGTIESIENSSELTMVEIPVVFDEQNFEAYITEWKACDFYDNDFGYEFSITVYNNSNEGFEFGIRDLKVNGWNIHDDGMYTSITRLEAGEKERTTWQISDICKKAGLNNLEEVVEITGVFFLGDINHYGVEIISHPITITHEDIENIKHAS